MGNEELASKINWHNEECSEEEKNFYITKALKVIEELYKAPECDKKAIDKIKRGVKYSFFYLNKSTIRPQRFIEDICRYGKGGNQCRALELLKDCMQDFMEELLKHNLIRPDAPPNEIKNALERAVYKAHRQLEVDSCSLKYDEDMPFMSETEYRDEALDVIISSEEHETILIDSILDKRFLDSLFKMCCEELRAALEKIQTEVNKGLRQIKNREHFNEQILNHTMRSLDYVVVLDIDQIRRRIINREFYEKALQYAKNQEEERFIRQWVIHLRDSPSMPLLINLFLAYNIPVDLWLIPIFALSILDAICLYVEQWEGLFRKFDIIKKQARRGLAKHQTTLKLKKIQTEQRIQTNLMRQNIEPVLELASLSTQQLTTKHIKLFLATVFKAYREQLERCRAINISAYLTDFLYIVLSRGWLLFPTLKKKLNLHFLRIPISLNISDYVKVFSEPHPEILDLSSIPLSRLSIKEIRKAIRDDKTVKTQFLSLYP